ncbi:MAG: TA system VapC family ribonuclease toxin [Terrimicrobiaceae bacterium]
MALFLPDANVLIHALHRGSAAHPACRQWLLDTAAQGDEIGLCEMVEAALLRIPTLGRLQLIPMQEVIGFWNEDLWQYSGTRRLSATASHNKVFSRLISDLSLFGNDVNDAWLAALAMDHRATLVSTDKGFARFPGLKWMDPTSQNSGRMKA